MKEQATQVFFFHSRMVDRTEENAMKLAQWILSNPQDQLQVNFVSAGDAGRVMKRVSEILERIAGGKE